VNSITLFDILFITYPGQRSYRQGNIVVAVSSSLESIASAELDAVAHSAPDKRQLSRICRRENCERRLLPTHSLSAKGVMGRRRQPRRNEDNKDHTDWYESHVMLIALSIVMFCIIDFIFTSIIIASGGIELNILMREAISLSLESFFVYKYSLTSLSLLLLVAHQNYCLFRLIKVRYVLYGFAITYAGVVAYEIVLISQIDGSYSLLLNV